MHMDSKINNPNNSLPHHIRGAFRGYETALSRYLTALDCPLSHFHILRLQWNDDGETQKHIATQAFMTESVASQVIKAMEKKGLLVRKTDRADSRKRRVFLTPEGKTLRERLVVEGIKISKQHAPDVSAEDVKTAIHVLIKVREAFDLYNANYSKEGS